LAHLTRLSQKPGVQSTIILSRETGAIVRTSGLISKSDSVNPNSTLPASAADETLDNYTNGTRSGGLQSAEDVARLVLKFVEAASTMVDSLDHEDELRLLRLRTKKNELVIVPSEYYPISIFRRIHSLIYHRFQVCLGCHTRYTTGLIWSRDFPNSLPDSSSRNGRFLLEHQEMAYTAEDMLSKKTCERDNRSTAFGIPT